MVLYDMKSISDQQEYDYSKWEEDMYRSCADTLEELFLPEKNPDLQAHLKENFSVKKEYVQRENVTKLKRKTEVKL